MDVAVAAKLDKLAELCEITGHASVAGWTIDSWTLSPEALTRLRDLYVEVINPTLEEELTNELRAARIDVEKLFFDETRARDVVTRSDMTELAAGASLLKVEGIPATHLELSNVPKRSRAVSEHGLDCIGLLLLDGDDDSKWRSGERLFLFSVKHTVVDADDLLAKLVGSLDLKKLSHAYVLAELRAFVSRLDDRGIRAKRAYLALVDYPNPARVTVGGVAALAPTHEAVFNKSLRKLPSALPARKHLRLLVIEGLDRLHELS